MEDQTDRVKEACLKTCGKVEVPSNDELRALNALRTIKEKVRDMRSRLSEISSGGGAAKPGEKETLQKELERLKSEWEFWERKSKEAAHERMVLLGHEEPSSGQ
jgi:predicted nuclease with TOPRIM domain